MNDWFIDWKVWCILWLIDWHCEIWTPKMVQKQFVTPGSGSGSAADLSWEIKESNLVSVQSGLSVLSEVWLWVDQPGIIHGLLQNMGIISSSQNVAEVTHPSSHWWPSKVPCSRSVQIKPLIRRLNDIFPFQTFYQVIDVPATQPPLQTTSKERELGKKKEKVCWRKTLKYASVHLSGLLLWDPSRVSGGAGAGKWKAWSLVTGWRNSNTRRSRNAASLRSGALSWRDNFKLTLIRGVKAPWHFQQLVNELRGTSRCCTLADQC